MAQDFPEKEHLVVLILEVCDSLDNCGGLVDDDALQAVLLVQVGVEVLFHRLPGLIVHVHALVVVFDLLQVDVRYKIPYLLERVGDAVRALLVALESGAVEALGLQRRELLLSEGWGHQVAPEIVLLRVGDKRLNIVERSLPRWPALIVASQLAADDALDL